jgi:hypothetical protein
MKPHKWAKEIKAWADGAEIEYRRKNGYGSLASEWVTITQEESDGINWGIDDWEFRIKPQPKEPKYLYVYHTSKGYQFVTDENTPIEVSSSFEMPTKLGKIKLEQNDE